MPTSIDSKPTRRLPGKATAKPTATATGAGRPTPVARGLEAVRVLDSLQKNIALLDPQGTIVSVNRAWKEFGLANGATSAHADSAGANYLDVCGQAVAQCSDDHAAAACAGIQAVLAGEAAVFELDYPCHGPLGPRWFLMRATPLAGLTGGAVVTHEDITEHRSVEIQRTGLITELLDLKAALDAHAIVAITDARGIITSVNDKFCAISKYSREELIGQDHRLVSSGHHPKEFIRNLWATISSGQIWKGELKNRAKDGSTYWVATTIVPLLGPNGKPVQYTAIRAEITQSKLYQERIGEILYELQSANRELSEFAYVVSHDLKAPLRGISSLASWLVSDYAEKLGPEGREHLNLISSRVTRLSGLIDAILTYSRAGRTREERSPVALGPLVLNTIDLLAPPANVEVIIAGELPELSIEPFKFQQVFQNLLSNAIDFMDKPQGRVVVSCAAEPAHWHFTVSDNGPGIEARHFDRIFQLFQTLAARDEMERTGVGLALVKKIVELEGGKIWVESTPGLGTAFHFTIPRGATPARSLQEGPTA